MAIRILLVDDHQMLRQGLHVLLKMQADFEVVGEAENGRRGVAMVEELLPDVVVMDLLMPDLNGVDATRRAIEAKVGIKVICLSSHVDEHMIAEMLKAGAVGYVLKDSAFEELAVAIRTVMSNKIYLSPTVAGLMVNDFVHSRVNGSSPAFTVLSSREREVLQLIAEGQSTKDIATRLHVSVKTVETHRRNMMDKLKLEGVAELTKFAVRAGITTL